MDFGSNDKIRFFRHRRSEETKISIYQQNFNNESDSYSPKFSNPTLGWPAQFRFIRSKRIEKANEKNTGILYSRNSMSVSHLISPADKSFINYRTNSKISSKDPFQKKKLNQKINIHKESKTKLKLPYVVSKRNWASEKDGISALIPEKPINDFDLLVMRKYDENDFKPKKKRHTRSSKCFINIEKDVVNLYHNLNSESTSPKSIKSKSVEKGLYTVIKQTQKPINELTETELLSP